MANTAYLMSEYNLHDAKLITFNLFISTELQTRCKHQRSLQEMEVSMG